ncbi:MAG: glycosyltransferase family 4 protein [Ignavibacteriae bacterium]|nr:glycosyltransferase family 4 protein [Ignavibacteriota bacterium]
MRIIFVIDQTYTHGGIQRMLSIKANYFVRKNNYEVIVITSEQKELSPCYEFDSKIRFIDLDINYERFKSYYNPINLFKIPNHILKLKKVLKKLTPDLVIVCNHGTETFFMPFIEKNIPKIKEFHFSKSIEKSSRENSKNLIKKNYFRFSDYIEGKYNRLIILNSEEKKYYKSNNVKIIPNPVTFFPNSVSTQTQNIAIAVGRIAPVKGFDILIDIWKLIYCKVKTWELHIYGEGEKEYMDILMLKIKNAGLENVVFFKGQTDKVKEKMLEASVYVMTSHNECFPLVLLEAQACGLPIVAFNCPHGPASIISDNTGKLIEMYDNDSFASQMLELMENKALRKDMGLNARKNAENYDIENIMSKWVNLFNELIH